MGERFYYLEIYKLVNDKEKSHAHRIAELKIFMDELQEKYPFIPDKVEESKINELKNKIHNVYLDFLQTADTEAKRINSGVDAGLKLKELKDKANLFMEDSEEKDTNRTQAKNCYKLADAYLKIIYECVCGITF